MKRDDKALALDRDGERARWVKEYRTSGLGLKRFAEQHGLNAGQLHYWVYGRGPSRGSEPPVPGFREVRLSAAWMGPAAWSAEVGLPDGTTVRLAGGTDVDWTLALVESLRGPCSR